MTTKKKAAKKEDDLSPEEEQIVKQTLEAEKQAQEEQKPKKSGIGLEHGLACSLLQDDLKDKQKYPYIKDLQAFSGNENNANKIAEWAADNNIGPLYFPTTYEEYLKGDNKTVIKLKELQEKDPNLTFTIVEPFKGTPEADIAKMAKDAGNEREDYEAYDDDEQKQQQQEAQEEGR